MASTPESAHVAMRPGSLALSNSVTFGEDEPDDEADANVAIESAEEPVEVTSVAAAAAADIKPDSLKHEPVTPKKPKGLALPAWIALEIAGVILAIALMVPLTATGVSEWATYVNLNRVPLTLNADSPVTLQDVRCTTAGLTMHGLQATILTQEIPSICGSSQAAAAISMNSQDTAKSVTSDISSSILTLRQQISATELLSIRHSLRITSHRLLTSQKRTQPFTRSSDLKRYQFD